MSNWISGRSKLFAEHYDLKYLGPEPGELEFLLRRIEEGGEPVLELGCGTGRNLVPLLERSLDVTGIDVAPDMLEKAREKCEQKGLAADLHIQHMEEFDLPRQFGTIYITSASLSVLDSIDDLKETLSRIYAHLTSGGVAALEFLAPPDLKKIETGAGIWKGGWDDTGDRGVITHRQVYEYDPKTQIRSSAMVFERFVDDQLQESELHTDTMRFWDVAFLEAEMADVGFTDIMTTNIFSDHELPRENTWLNVRARKA
jgi:SAM-dependent methyltransferase